MRTRAQKRLTVAARAELAGVSPRLQSMADAVRAYCEYTGDSDTWDRLGDGSLSMTTAYKATAGWRRAVGYGRGKARQQRPAAIRTPDGWTIRRVGPRTFEMVMDDVETADAFWMALGASPAA